MILISKTRDYYDYLIGIYGRDEKKVFKRKNTITANDIKWLTPKSKYPKDKKLQEKYHVTQMVLEKKENSVEIHLNNKKYKLEQVHKGIWKQHKYYKYDHYLTRLISNIDTKDEDKFIDWIPTTYNAKHREPVLISYTEYEYTENALFCLNKIKTPILETFGFYNILSAQDVYVEIDAFLGWLHDNPQPEDNRTDIQKLESKGFDKKTSFRNIK